MDSWNKQYNNLRSISTVKSLLNRCIPCEVVERDIPSFLKKASSDLFCFACTAYTQPCVKKGNNTWHYSCSHIDLFIGHVVTFIIVVNALFMLWNTKPVRATMAMTSCLTCVVIEAIWKPRVPSLPWRWQDRTITPVPGGEECLTCVSPPHIVKPEKWVWLHLPMRDEPCFWRLQVCCCGVHSAWDEFRRQLMRGAAAGVVKKLEWLEALRDEGPTICCGWQDCNSWISKWIYSSFSLPQMKNDYALQKDRFVSVRCVLRVL